MRTLSLNDLVRINMPDVRTSHVSELEEIARKVGTVSDQGFINSPTATFRVNNRARLGKCRKKQKAREDLFSCKKMDH